MTPLSRAQKHKRKSDHRGDYQDEIRLQVQGRYGAEFVAIGVDDIQSLHAGVIYWGMEQMANQYQHTRRLMPCVYVDLTRLPETKTR